MYVVVCELRSLGKASCLATPPEGFVQVDKELLLVACEGLTRLGFAIQASMVSVSSLYPSSLPQVNTLPM
jgi:hypothetical protein